MFKHKPITSSFAFTSPRKNTDGTKTVNIRLTQGKPKYRIVIINSLPLRVKPEEWNEKLECMKVKHQSHVEINHALREIKNKIEIFLAKNKQCTPEDVFNHLYLEQNEELDEKINFIDCYADFENVPNKDGSAKSGDTKLTYQSKINTLKRYLNNQPLYLEDITENWLEAYRQHLLKTNGQPSVHNHLKNFRAVYNSVIPPKLEKNVFNYFKFTPGTNNKKQFLVRDELSTLKKVNNTHAQSHEKLYAGLIFEFQFNSRGMRIGDALRVKFENIVDGRLYYKQNKVNGELISCEINERMMEILNIMGWPGRNTGRIFPYLPDYFESMSDKEQSKLVGSKVCMINSKLKKIASEGKITKKITTHVARHSMANILLEDDTPLNIIKDVLGHSNLQSTAVYTSTFNNKKADNATQRATLY